MSHHAIRTSTALLGAVLLVGLLVGCKSSPKVVADSVDGGSWVKCAMGQSYVNEAGDDNPSHYGGATEAWKDYYCANEDTGPLWWNKIEVGARKYNGGTLCDTAPTVSSTTSRSVSTQGSGVCAPGGSSQIWVVGTHRAARNGSSTIRQEESATPQVTSY